MLTEKILFQNRSLAFYYHPRPAPPQFGKRPDFFRVFFSRTLPLPSAWTASRAGRVTRGEGGVGTVAGEAWQELTRKMTLQEKVLE